MAMHSVHPGALSNSLGGISGWGFGMVGMASGVSRAIPEMSLIHVHVLIYTNG